MELVSFVLLHATMFRRDGNMCFFLALHIVLPYPSLSISLSLFLFCSLAG